MIFISFSFEDGLFHVGGIAASVAKNVLQLLSGFDKLLVTRHIDTLFAGRIRRQITPTQPAADLAYVELHCCQYAIAQGQRYRVYLIGYVEYFPEKAFFLLLSRTGYSIGI